MRGYSAKPCDTIHSRDCSTRNREERSYPAQDQKCRSPRARSLSHRIRNHSHLPAAVCATRSGAVRAGGVAAAAWRHTDVRAFYRRCLVPLYRSGSYLHLWIRRFDSPEGRSRSEYVYQHVSGFTLRSSLTPPCMEQSRPRLFARYVSQIRIIQRVGRSPRTPRHYPENRDFDCLSVHRNRRPLAAGMDERCTHALGTHRIARYDDRSKTCTHAVPALLLQLRALSHKSICAHAPLLALDPLRAKIHDHSGIRSSALHRSPPWRVVALCIGLRHGSLCESK